MIFIYSRGLSENAGTKFIKVHFIIIFFRAIKNKVCSQYRLASWFNSQLGTKQTESWKENDTPLNLQIYNLLVIHHRGCHTRFSRRAEKIIKDPTHPGVPCLFLGLGQSMVHFYSVHFKHKTKNSCNFELSFSL